MSPISYRASLKNPEVEEPVDLLVHRPLGYLVARAAYPTPITADALTILSMLIGVSAGALFYLSVITGTDYAAVACALFTLSAIVDCSDGQLARMRKSSSRHGRMLDGAVDGVVQIAVLPAMVVHMIWRRGGIHAPGSWWWLAGTIVAIVTGLRHTTLYDTFKNIYARNTDSDPKDCDDLDDFMAQYREAAAAGPLGFRRRFLFEFYRFHLQTTAQTIRWIDPFIPSRFRDMPPYSPQRAAEFRRANRGLMRAWSFFGIGTHIFIVAACVTFARLEYYVLIRAIGFNVVLLFLVPLQRRASRVFFGANDAKLSAP